jgi:transglutaminase-like putative cysteine protease
MNQATLISNTRYALFVLFICYLPHFATGPWWLFIFIFAAIGYRIIADYFGYLGLNKWIRFSLVVLCLFLLKVQYGSIVSSGFFIGFLLTFIGLKCVEVRNLKDLNVLVICNFYLILSALIVVQKLWIIAYLFIAILANLSLMLKLNATEASLRQIGGKSAKQLLIAIPLSIILFYIFPRITDPLWEVPSATQNHIEFNEQMNQGSIGDLFSDDSTAFRVTFKNKPILKGYWRGLVLGFYNGTVWSPTWYNETYFSTLAALSAHGEADYEIILEPHQKKWLFYAGYPAASRPNLLFSPNYGLLNAKIITQRFAYSLSIQSIPYEKLSPREKTQNIELPKDANPRLKSWAKEQFTAMHKDPKDFIAFLRDYIRHQPFWYTLTPPPINSDNYQMDFFWFDTQKGFCEHYASAVTIILRAAGIPARVVVGYHGGSWNPLAQYLTIQQNDAHAWLEYWQEGTGWQLLDPTTFIAPERIDQKIKDAQTYRLTRTNYSSDFSTSWFQNSKFIFDSAHFFAERWLLFYNQNVQRDLLQKLGLGPWNLILLVTLTAISLILFIILVSLYYQWIRKRRQDPLLIEYHLLQKEFRRFNVPTPPSATLNEQCMDLINNVPSLKQTIDLFLCDYEQLRLKHLEQDTKEDKNNLLSLFKKLRKKINQIKSLHVKRDPINI